MKRVPTSSGDWSIVTAIRVADNATLKFSYLPLKVVGKGTFGVVSKVSTRKGDVFALKSQTVDKNFQNRELALMKSFDHPNVVKLFYYYMTANSGKSTKLNLVMEYVPDTMARIIHQFKKRRLSIPTLLIRVFTYQILRGVNYLHMQSVAHRDLKPSNILVNPESSAIKIADFGSASPIQSSEQHVAYICTRQYRAPELILGNSRYTCKVDTWAAGLILCELYLQKPIFNGESNLGQLTEVIRIMGAPTKRQTLKLQPKLVGALPKRKAVPWSTILADRVEDDAINLISQLVTYDPDDRVDCFIALAHCYFDKLRESGALLPNGESFPPLFNFSEEEVFHAPKYISILTGSSSSIVRTL